ncbi:MAG: NUDIX domain-containing protein [Gomphosphaeria aponina SAG 52.96 = DSM 107014]|uniref:NUDIX domain-containing protein n=1 Tax=Gomphosphaeria aponina SAG 52.96 = DSM 107014 TaxID=1521640 RepID=A0A941GR12_9CHRO|nr:NUDIX domain-containing protein [Gomphosphaeria aponina SAG 52.96 = DSM 107014]
MGHKAGEIRVLVLGLIKEGDRTFLTQGFDSVTGETFYRAMGGGVEFGETSRAALEREFLEEINAAITNIKYLGCLESIFVHQGKKGQEIIQLYECDFVDRKFYETEQINFNEGKRAKTALWVNIQDCKERKIRVVPEEYVKYL